MHKGIAVTEEILERINKYSVTPLTAQQVYCFSVLLCDNDIDRDNEKFDTKALEKLAELYVGRTGIFDHDPKGAKQSARIYAAEVKEHPDRKTADGEVYTALMGYAYMVRTDENKALIAEIDGGIKKEVSVGCAVAKKTCSVCGSDMMKGGCAHIKGKLYGDSLCYAILEEPTDAYEWSFVAVPAQRNAGVTKKFTEGGECCGECARADKAIECACEELRGDIMKLSYFAKPFRTAKAVSSETQTMELYELIRLKRSLEKQVREQTDSGELSFITEVQEDNEGFKL